MNPDMVMAMQEINLCLQGKNSIYWQAECMSQFTGGQSEINAFLWLLFVEIALSGIFLTEFK